MEEESNKNNNLERQIYSPRRRKIIKKNVMGLNLLEGLGIKQSSDKNALNFANRELERRKTLRKTFIKKRGILLSF